MSRRWGLAAWLRFIRLHVLHARAYRPQPAATLRLVVTGAAFLLGYLGYHRLYPPHRFYDYLENGYRTLGLLVVRMPEEYPDLPVELQFARFALPIMTIWMGVGAFLDSVRRPLRLFATIRLDGHLVVTGSGDRAASIATESLRTGREVVVVVEEAGAATIPLLESAGVLVVVGRLNEAETWARAAITHAADVVVCTGANAANLRAAIAIRDAVHASPPSGGSPLRLVVESSQDDVAIILEGAFASIRDTMIEYRLLSPPVNLARELLPRLLPSFGTPAEPGSVLLLGETPLIAAVFEHVVRNAVPGAAVAVAAPSGVAWRERLLSHRPGLPDHPLLSFHEAGDATAVPAALAGWIAAHPGAAVVIDFGNDDGSLLLALALRRLARDRALPTGPLFVHQSGEGVAIHALEFIEGEVVDLSRITVFGALADESSPQAVLQEGLDGLARTIHGYYLAEGATGDAAVPWAELRETYRQASRHQADHVDVKLAAIECGRVRGESESAFDLSDTEVEMLAALEHHRWCLDRWLDGWVYGPVKDATAKTHPSLVPYDQLTEDVKEFDRCAVRIIPALLRSGGQSVRRLMRIPAHASMAAGSMDAAVADAIGRRMIPVLEIVLDDDVGLADGEQALSRNLRYDLILRQPVAGLRKSLPSKRLRTVLDGATRIRFISPQERREG